MNNKTRLLIVAYTILITMGIMYLGDAAIWIWEFIKGGLSFI